jgi:hypothetical protein
MLGEPEKQFSLTRAALSTSGGAKSKFLSVSYQYQTSQLKPAKQKREGNYEQQIR